MNGNDIVKSAMSESGITQLKMSELLGYTSQATVSQRLNTPRMSLDKFVEMLSVIGYEVVVRKTKVDQETGEVTKEDKWVVRAKKEG